jgi:hypothetical protein
VCPSRIRITGLVQLIYLNFHSDTGREKQDKNYKSLMSTIPFPTKIESLTSEWLTQALELSGLVKGAVVSGFFVERLSGAGTSSLYRILLKYEKGVRCEPQSLVMKSHATCASNRG